MTDHQLGTTCERCGVRHRVVESMPNRPFTAEDVARLDRSCPFVGAVGASDGSAGAATDDGDATGDDDEPSSDADSPDDADRGGESARAPATNTIVVSTAGATRLLRRAEDHGWVVDREREHADGDDPYAVGVDLFAEAAPDERLSVDDARTVLALDG